MIKPIKESSVKRRRKFDETFKREAVPNWFNSGKPAAVVGEERGLGANVLHAWRKLLAKPGSLADLQSHLEATPRELHHARE